VKPTPLFAALTFALLAACSGGGSKSSKVLDVISTSLAGDNFYECYHALPTSVIAPDRNNDGKTLASDAWYRMLQQHGYTTIRPYRSTDMMDGNADNRALDNDPVGLKTWTFTDKGTQTFKLGTGEDDHGLRLVCFARPQAMSIVSDVSANTSFDTALRTVTVNEVLDYESWVTPSDKGFIINSYKNNPIDSSLLPALKPGHEASQETFNVDEPSDGPPHLAGQ
jgi:hypothetical protein